MAGCHWPVIIWLLIFAKPPVTIYNMRRREILHYLQKPLRNRGSIMEEYWHRE